jgi:hypothetical protein
MATTAAASELGGATAVPADVAARAAVWPLWFALGSSTAAAFGVHWDIAWHRSIGRDAFWSPPHVAIYASAVLAALAALAQVVPATFGRGAARESAVRVLGFRGPLGAFISAWGGIAMLASAPFDDWWHNAYGLDVKILSPPHIVLASGILALHLGAAVMIAGAMNRSASGGARRRTLEALLLVVGGNTLIALITVFMEKTVRPFMHGGTFYVIVATAVPVVLAAVAGGTRRRWAGTTAVVAYSIFLLTLLWTFPLVRVQPRLGPVLVPTTNLVPPEFPLALLPAALALDAWLWLRRGATGRASALATAVGGGLLFTAIFFACQWPFASFLMSPHARNFFWGARYFDFWLPPESFYRRNVFRLEPSAVLARGLAVAALSSMLSVAAGRGVGRWLARLRR